MTYAASQDDYTCFFQTDSEWASTEYGHIYVTLGNGKEASDCIRNMKYRTNEYSVFVPVKK